MEARYNNAIEEQQLLLKSLHKKSAIFGNTRLALALALAAIVALLIVFWFSVIYLVLLIVALCGFAFLSVIHADIASQIHYRKGLIDINKEYLMRLDGRWKGFGDCGNEYVDSSHDYSLDLDIFGQKSLFQFLNLTKTPYGRKQLRDDLAAPNYTNEQINDRQEAIAELGKLNQFSQDFQYHSRQIAFDKDLPKVVNYVKNKQEFARDIVRKIFTPVPFLMLLLAVIFFSAGSGGLRIAGSVLMGVQALVWLVLSPKTLAYLSSAERIHYSLSDYSKLYALIESQEFDSKLLKRIQADMTASELSAANGTKKLARVLFKIQLRTSGIMYILLNLLFLWDILCALSLSSWTRKYAKHVEEWFCSLGELESLLSFSVLDGTLSTKCRARVMEGKHTLSASQIGHPLLDNNARVCNDFCLTKNINIISGSNMSGKTTFLRTLGINLVLAKNGSAVCAKQMTFSSMRLVSSMRVSDDLSEGVSTFYWELKKIKRVLDVASGNSDTLFLIDEIFRGTISSDRTAGAKAVIKKLKENNAYGFLTTHDLKMCEQSEGVSIANYSFSEHFDKDELKFDYKIRQGIAQTTNGEYLMRFIGII